MLYAARRYTDKNTPVFTDRTYRTNRTYIAPAMLYAARRYTDKNTPVLYVLYVLLVLFAGTRSFARKRASVIGKRSPANALDLSRFAGYIIFETTAIVGGRAIQP
jgi:hypothetical protein